MYSLALVNASVLIALVDDGIVIALVHDGVVIALGHDGVMIALVDDGVLITLVDDGIVITLVHDDVVIALVHASVLIVPAIHQFFQTESHARNTMKHYTGTCRHHKTTETTWTYLSVQCSNSVAYTTHHTNRHLTCPLHRHDQ